MQSNDIIDVLENYEATTFIDERFTDDIATLSLRFSGKTSFNITVCLQLLELYRKATHKLPFFVEHKLALDKRSYEQSTSQRVALYKSQLINGGTLLDITAGLGVDATFLSSGFDYVKAVEKNENLHKMASYNMAKAKVTKVQRILGDGKSELKGKYDWIYIDPDRRNDTKRLVTLENLEPNVLDLLPQLEEIARMVYIKISPLFDVQEVWRLFENCDTIHLIAEKGEVKEVGVVLNHTKSTLKKEIVLKDVVTGFEVKLDKDVNLFKLPKTDVSYSNILVPDPLVAKANVGSFLLKDKNSAKHNSFEIYYSNDSFIEGFRSFEILYKSGLSSKEIKANLSRLGITKINIVIKGLNDKPSVWHKKLGTSDGGEFYLFVLKSASTSEALIVRKIIS